MPRSDFYRVRITFQVLFGDVDMFEVEAIMMAHGRARVRHVVDRVLRRYRRSQNITTVANGAILEHILARNDTEVVVLDEAGWQRAMYTRLQYLSQHENSRRVMTCTCTVILINRG